MVSEAKRHFLKRRLRAQMPQPEQQLQGNVEYTKHGRPRSVQETMDIQYDAVSRSGKGFDRSLLGQVVLVLQGGGVLGSYQAGVYQALHEASIEPDWIIGTSVGAIPNEVVRLLKEAPRTIKYQHIIDRMVQAAKNWQGR
jgi:predicted acylesterase/phospholipase RssA